MNIHSYMFVCFSFSFFNVFYSQFTGRTHMCCIQNEYIIKCYRTLSHIEGMIYWEVKASRLSIEEKIKKFSFSFIEFTVLKALTQEALQVIRELEVTCYTHDTLFSNHKIKRYLKVSLSLLPDMSAEMLYAIKFLEELAQLLPGRIQGFHLAEQLVHYLRAMSVDMLLLRSTAL